MRKTMSTNTFVITLVIIIIMVIIVIIAVVIVIITMSSESLFRLIRLPNFPSEFFSCVNDASDLFAIMPILLCAE